MACSFTGWDAVDTAGSASQVLIVGSPDSPTPVPRYSGPCAAMARGPGNYVTDVLPRSDWAFNARFYVFVDVPANEVEFFRASNSSGQSIITIRQNLTTLKFENAAGVTTTSPVVPGRWYAIELDWYAGRAMTVQLRGAGASPSPVFSTAVAGPDDRINKVSLGWISGAGTGRIAIDGYVQWRLTGRELGRLCRGHAGNNYSVEATTSFESLSSRDMVLVRNEVAGLGLVNGQPDCDENGVINTADTTCIGTAIVRESSCL